MSCLLCSTSSFVAAVFCHFAVLCSIVDFDAEVESSAVHDQGAHFEHGAFLCVVEQREAHIVVQQVKQVGLMEDESLGDADGVQFHCGGGADSDEPGHFVVKMGAEAEA